MPYIGDNTDQMIGTRDLPAVTGAVTGSMLERMQLLYDELQKAVGVTDIAPTASATGSLAERVAQLQADLYFLPFATAWRVSADPDKYNPALWGNFFWRLGTVDVAGNLPISMDQQSNVAFRSGYDATERLHYALLSSAAAAAKLMGGAEDDFAHPLGPYGTPMRGDAFFGASPAINTFWIEFLCKFSAAPGSTTFGIGLTSNAAATTFVNTDRVIAIRPQSATNVQLYVADGGGVGNDTSFSFTAGDEDVNEWHRYRIDWKEASILCYIDDVLGATLSPTTFIPTRSLLPAIFMPTNATATLQLAWVRGGWKNS